MSTVKNLRTVDVEKIQIDEGLIYLDYGVTGSERKLAPTRGGGNFLAQATVRDIEFDGRSGKTAGMQTIDDQTASLKVTSICLSQENLALALPGCRVTGTGAAAVIKNPKCGVLSAASGSTVYATNVTMFAKTMDGKFKKITIYSPLHEGGIDVKAVQKAEGELALEFLAHYTTADLNGDLYQIEEVSTDPQESESTQTNGSAQT